MREESMSRYVQTTRQGESVIKKSMSRYVQKHNRKSSTISKVFVGLFLLAIVSVVAPKFETTSNIIDDNLPASVSSSINAFSKEF